MENTSEIFQRAQRDGRLLAEDLPGLTEEALREEAEVQLRLLAAAGVSVKAPDDYRQGLFAGYQSA